MSDTPTLQQTPLAEAHRALGARMVPFAGWEMPVQYPQGILAEHRAVREGVGVFDVCHMGEFEVTGPGHVGFVNRVTSNDVAALDPGQVQYSCLLHPRGGIVDDCTVYRYADRILLVVNAANIAKNWAHLTAQAGPDVQLADRSGATGLLALQGPLAEPTLARVSAIRLSDIGYYRFTEGKVAGAACLVSRTGYTGEDGFEIYCPWEATLEIWEALLGAGAVPIGLGARDTLRLEVGYALYGNDIDDSTTPLEAGLGWITRLGKGPFTGAEALKEQKAAGLRRKLVGFRTVGKGIPRHAMPVLVDGQPVDSVRSGTMSPTLGYPIGTCYLPLARAGVGSRFQVDIRGEPVEAEVVKRPFYTGGSVRK